MPHSSPQNLDDLARSSSVDSTHSVIPPETSKLLFASFSPEILHQVKVAIGFYNKAKENFNLKRYAEVETDTTQALDAVESELPTVYSYLKEPILVLRANARQRMSKYREAELDYSIALQTLVWTERLQALLNRAVCRLSYEDFPAAAYDLNLVINSRFKSDLLYQALVYRSQVYYQQERYYQSGTDALKALSSQKLSSTLKKQAYYYYNYLVFRIKNCPITVDTDKTLPEVKASSTVTNPVMLGPYQTGVRASAFRRLK